MTINEIEAAGEKFFTQDELDEIQYKIDAVQESIDYDIKHYGPSVVDDEPSNFYDGFKDMWDHAEDIYRFSGDKEHRRQAKKVFDRCQEFALVIGVYRAMSDEEYKNSYVFGGSKAQAFPKIKGQRCEFVKHPE